VSTCSLWPTFLVIAVSDAKPFLFLQYVLFEIVSVYSEHNNFKCSMFNWTVIFSLRITKLPSSTVNYIFHVSVWVHFCCHWNAEISVHATVCLIIMFITFCGPSDECASVSAVSRIVPCSVLHRSDVLGSDTHRSRSVFWVMWPSSVLQMDFVALTAQSESFSTKQTQNKKLQYPRVTLKILTTEGSKFDFGPILH
jgi:hypothetical protein